MQRRGAPVTTPSDPFSNPDRPDQPQQPDGDPYGAPPQGYGQPPAHGQPPAGYGAPQDYGQPGGFGSPPGWGQPPQKTGTNGLAIASLVTAFLCWPLGLALGFVAKSQIKKTGQGGDGLATAGIVIAILNALLSVYLVSSGGGFGATA
jgi:hypothetical protein